ncbi:MAG: AbrB/MazE/SpoVT family DNA-binding domain-containing protein [Candidatus Pacebacteria bacterium]|nr:AbrB/MazE/SpoVT family DNA-binding domain-containing protein [Candidatus Paceibacterota bacterium]
MKTRIKKWGNSLAIRLPKTSVDLLNLKENNEVSFDFDKDQIIIKPENKKEYSLSELISKINSKNIHKEIDWGKPVGKEIW